MAVSRPLRARGAVRAGGANCSRRLAGSSYEKSRLLGNYRRGERSRHSGRREVRQIFQRKGFSGEILEKIVETITSNRSLWIDTMLAEEYGLQANGLDPFKSASTTFLAFILVGAIPLLPFLLPALAVQAQFVASACLAGIMFRPPLPSLRATSCAWFSGSAGHEQALEPASAQEMRRESGGCPAGCPMRSAAVGRVRAHAMRPAAAGVS